MKATPTLTRRLQGINLVSKQATNLELFDAEKLADCKDDMHSNILLDKQKSEL